jgi:hypothetical protein
MPLDVKRTLKHPNGNEIQFQRSNAMTDEQGNIIPPKFGPQTIGEELAGHLTTSDGKGQDTATRLARFQLGCKLGTAKGPVELTSEEITLIRNAIDAANVSILVYGQLVTALDGKPDPFRPANGLTLVEPGSFDAA